LWWGGHEKLTLLLKAELVEVASLLGCDCMLLDRTACPATQLHIPEDLNLQQHHCENLRFHSELVVQNITEMFEAASVLVSELCATGQMQVFLHTVSLIIGCKQRFLYNLAFHMVVHL
jgi:hypothetical protein